MPFWQASDERTPASVFIRAGNHAKKARERSRMADLSQQSRMAVVQIQ